jgi:hypothetical protein
LLAGRRRRSRRGRGHGRHRDVTAPAAATAPAARGQKCCGYEARSEYGFIHWSSLSGKKIE